MLAIQLEEGDAAQLAAAGATLKSEHSGSTYAQFAAMLEARIAVEAEDLERAEASLRWALSVGDPHSDIGTINPVAPCTGNGCARLGGGSTGHS